MEEDHVPSPDIFVTLDFLLTLKNFSPMGKGENCWAVSMGGSPPCPDLSLDILGRWSLSCSHTKILNTGVALNRSVFEAIRVSDFLVFQDGWDWSLYHVVQTRQMLECQPNCQPRMLSPQGKYKFILQHIML